VCIGEPDSAGNVDGRYNPCGFARCKSESSSTSDRAADDDDAMAVGVGAARDDIDRQLQIIRFHFEIALESRQRCISRTGRSWQSRACRAD
jgi:hypothetical protein